MKAQHLLTLVALAAAAIACEYTRESNPIAPTELSRSLVGVWTSAGASSTGLPDPDTCGGLTWNVTSQTATSISGRFGATCAGNVKLEGTGTGTLRTPTLIDWTAAGTATPEGLPPCDFTLTGTANIGTDIEVTYTGRTCYGPISGTQRLRQR
jgi:hypothetical protein